MGNPNYGDAYKYQTVFSSAARTATPTAITITNKGNFNACMILESTTAVTSSPSVVFNIDIWNKIANTFVEVLDSAAVATVSENVYQLGAKAESGDVSSTFPPTERLRIRPVHGNADSITYTVTVYWYRA